MPGRMEGAVAVVIGGASGIGWATAQLLAAEGVSVVIGDIDIEGGRKRAVELGGRAEAVRVDVVDEESVKGIFEGAEAQHGRLDIAVNCAGVNLPGYITDLEAQSWRRTVDICLTGGFFVIKHAARAMTAGGSIVSITSLNARQAAAGFAGYCSAKAGLAMLTEVAALELGDRGIRVNAVSPGLVETSLVEGLTGVPAIQADFTENTPLGRNGLPRDVAEAVFFLASDASSWITGEVLDVNGGAHLRRYPDVMKHIEAMQ